MQLFQTLNVQAKIPTAVSPNLPSTSIACLHTGINKLTPNFFYHNIKAKRMIKTDQNRSN